MPDGQSHRDARFAFVGGRIALDFVNTRAWNPAGPDEERLTTFAGLLDWGVESNAVAASRRRVLREAADANREASLRALERARLVRELLHRIFAAIVDGEPLDPALVAAYNGCLSRALDRLRLSASADSLEWEGAPNDLDSVLHPVIWSAAQLLTSGDRAILRRCANPSCGWLFVDESRNGMRRWCEMRECGNRAKARRYYARRRNREPRSPLD